MLVRVAEGGEVSSLVQFEVVEQQDALPIDDRLVWPPDDQRAIETAFDLFGLVDVRVVPERSCVRQHKAIFEARAGLHSGLDALGAVHGGGNPQPVPVDGRRFAKVVLQRNEE